MCEREREREIEERELFWAVFSGGRFDSGCAIDHCVTKRIIVSVVSVVSAVWFLGGFSWWSI